MYKTHEVEYLLDNEDSVSHHEACGNAKIRKCSAQREIDALQTLDRITRTEVVHGKFLLSLVKLFPLSKYFF